MKRILVISICMLSVNAYSQQVSKPSNEELKMALYYTSCVSTDSLKQIQETIKASLTKADFYKHYYRILTLESWTDLPEIKNYNKEILFKLINKSSNDFLYKYDCLENESSVELVQEIDSLFSILEINKTEEDQMELHALLARNMGCSYFSVEPSYIGENVIQIEGSVGMAGNTFCKYYKINPKNNDVTELESKPSNGFLLDQKLKNIITKEFEVGYSSFGSQMKINSSNSNLFEFTVPVYNDGEDQFFPSYEVKYTAVNESEGFKLVGEVFLKKFENDKWILL